jgi:N-acetylneuraminic acid mutarotase
MQRTVLFLLASALARGGASASPEVGSPPPGPRGLQARDRHGPHPILSERIGDQIRRALQDASTHSVTLAHPVTDLVSRYSVESDVWSAVAPMSTKRSDHTTTAIGTKLYVAGGCAGDQAQFCPALASVFEAYDPATNTWSTLPPLPRDRYRHAAVAIGTKLYLLGGADLAQPSGDYYDNIVTQVDVFDTVANIWLTTGLPPPLPTANARVDLAAFAAGTEIHVLGGYDPIGNYDSTAAHSVFDTASPAAPWVAAAPMAQDRGDFCATASPSEPVAFVFGGFTSADFSQALDSLERADPTTGGWTALGGTNAVHRGDAACATTTGANPKLLVFGGENTDTEAGRAVLSTAEAYDPAADSWSQLAPLPTQRFRFSAAAVSVAGGEFVYVTGGQLASSATRADIPWDSADAAIALAADGLTVDATTQLVFSWAGAARGIVLLPDADALAACAVDGPDAVVLAAAAANGLLMTPPAGVSTFFLSSSLPADCAAGYKLRVNVRGFTAEASPPAAAAAAAAGAGQEDWGAAIWSTGGELQQPRSDHTAVAWPVAGHPGSKVYIAGGCSANQPSKSQYAFADGVVVQSATPDEYCVCPSVTDSFEVYDPVAADATALPPMPHARYRHASVATNGNVYLVGGWRKLACTAADPCSYPGEEAPATEVDVYNVQQGTWRTLAGRFPPAGFPAVGDASAFVLGTSIYATGGYDAGYTAQSSTFRLDLASASGRNR